jgi:site-specific DNA-methyltransferase (adenine-specific)
MPSSKYKVYNSDCIIGMQQYVDAGSVDLIFTDPPYGIDGDGLDVLYHREESFVVPGYVDVPLSNYAQFSSDWIAECARVLRPGGSIYIVSGYTNLHHILNALHASDLVEVNHIIAQYTFGVSTKNKFVSSHYHVLFWMKPEKGKQKRTFNSNWKYSEQKDSYNDRLSVQPMPRTHLPNQIKNKNQLNEDFIAKFILYSSNRGDTVLDCFGGGMTTGRTALRYGRKFIGFELNKNACDAFIPTLDSVEELPDPVPMDASEEEIAKREKMRQGWRKKRAERKTKKLLTNPDPMLLFVIGDDGDDPNV